MKIEIKKSKVVWTVFLFLLAFELFIVFGDVFLNEMKWIDSRSLRRFFNITREDSMANWFSSMQTLLVALALFAIAFVEKSKIRVVKGNVWSWALFGLFFAFLSLDDGAKLHERLGTFFKDWLETQGIDLIGYGWQLVLGPLLIVVGAYLIWFLLKQLDRRLFTQFAIAFVLLFLAIALDYVEGLDLEPLTPHTITHGMKVVEEFFEMFAMTILLVVFLQVLLNQRRELTLQLK